MIAQQMIENIKNSSWIRAMFEEGEKLRQIHGADKVFDFSLGNPDYEPPEAVRKALNRLVSEENKGLHRYTSNAGYPDVREKIALLLSEESGQNLAPENIVMTCGAAGGLNVVLKTILDPDEEVIVFAPYFVEYRFYIENHGGKAVIVPTDSNFEPDLEALKKSISSRCKAIILNSPNNPSGVVYSAQTLKDIAILLEAKEREYKHEILVISDEPYTKLIYGGVTVPNMMKIFDNCMVVNSFSKSLALPGERIGYIAVSSKINDAAILMEGLTFANRTLGFVNAPSLFQKLAGLSLDQIPDTSEYQKRRDFLYENLIRLGFSCVKPQGAFYLFPKSPMPDDIEFVKRALKYNLLLVPGTGFACPGYFRIAYCTSMETIKNSIPAFEALAAEVIG
ncbi:MAG: pyridoxal phosphate-dependent aminotransferase [Syntrophomonadaceae bacterium]|nr:pyridoxal phosphate-dependent aminotransferase [Syntrophomonadaceae bacterium]MDD3023643.1 pyridoxal phosphate-dependent aminotransferase [Syntrophomonadaceae bacterium]